MTKVFRGAMTAIITPFRGDEVDYDALKKLVARQIDAGIDGIVSVGTTGESATLSVDEHVEVIKQTIIAAGGKVPVIAGAGANSTSEAIELTKASEEAGADAVLQVCPYYNKPSQRGMIQHFARIAESTPLPIILYNVPGRTSSDLLAESVAELAQLPTIVAIKDATGDLRRGSEIVALCGDSIDLLSGDDFTTFPLYSIGAKGVISVVSNATPKWMAAMWDHVVAGEWQQARELHYRMLPLVDMLFRESNPVPVKAAVSSLGYCSPDVRSPLAPCSEALSQQLAGWLESKGIR